jgi:phage terminase small subunit
MGNGYKNAYGLTPKQEIFVKEYLTNGQNALQAAITAGYTPQTAQKKCNSFLKLPEINKRIAIYRNRKSIQDKMSFDYKLDKLNKVVDNFIPDDEIPMAKLATVAIQAIAEANRMQGHYSPDKTINANLNLNADMDIKKIKDITEEVIRKSEREY